MTSCGSKCSTSSSSSPRSTTATSTIGQDLPMADAIVSMYTRYSFSNELRTLIPSLTPSCCSF
jgi:hypothetical protein